MPVIQRISHLLTVAQAEAAIEQLGQMCPQQKALLDQYRSVILARAVKGIMPPPNSPILQVKGATPPVQPMVAMATPVLNPCTTNIAVTAVNAVLFIAGIAGMHIPAAIAEDEFITALISRIGVNGVIGLQRTVDAVANASGATETVTALANFAGEIWTVGGFSAILDVLAQSTPWYVWALTGVMFVGQITLWFASGGTALAAQIALNLAQAGFVVSSAVAAKNACS